MGPGGSRPDNSPSRHRPSADARVDGTAPVHATHPPRMTHKTFLQLNTAWRRTTSTNEPVLAYA